MRDSDATVILSLGRQLTGGSKLTEFFAKRWYRPLIHISAALDDGEAFQGQVAAILNGFLDQHFVKVLNVAGPRDSTEPGVGHFVKQVLDEASKVTSARA